MFKKLHSLLTLAAVMAIAPLTVSAASGDPVSIPTPTGTFIDWNYGDFNGTSGKVENNGDNIGSTGANTVVTFNLVSSAEGSYQMTIATGHKGTAYMDVTLSDATGNKVFADVHKIENTGSWSPSTTSTFDIPTIPAGSYTLTLAARDLQDSGYAGNWGKLAFYDASTIVDDSEHIPGTVSIARSTLIGGARNEGQNIGYIKNGCGTSNELTVDEAGVYAMTIPLSKYGDGTLTATVIDKASKAVEAETVWTIPAESNNYEPQTINLEGELTKGKKTFKVVFNAPHGGFIANYKDMTLAKIADRCATFRGVAIEGQDVTTGEGYDWNCNLPLDFGATTTLKVNANANAIIAATAVDGQGNAVTVTDNGDGTYTLPTPAGSTETIVTFNVSAQEGVLVFRDSYTVRLYRIGDILINKLTIDDVDAPAALIEALNVKGDNATATLSDWIFTASPVIVATFADNSKVTATGTVDGANGTFTFTGEAGSKSKAYTINIAGFHIYEAAPEDEMVKLVYDGALNQPDGSWNNGLYSLNPANDGWGGTQFKFKNNTEITLTVPANVVVKQIKFTNLKDNYAPGTIGYVTSEGATVYLPTASYFKNGDGAEKNIFVNFEGHKAGTPVKFLFTPGSQPVAWFEILTQKETLTTPPAVTSTSATPTTGVNHTVATLNFDREMKSATATVGEQTIEGEVAGATVRFKLWDLPYNATSTLTIAAGKAEDTFGNVNDKAITFPIEVGAPATVEAIEPIVVSNVAEWKEALKQVNTSNTSADAPRTVIFVRNGDYDFGSEEQTFTCHNVSVIGESRDGVILHGNRTGISNPIISTRKATGTYFQDLIIRNDLDFGADKRQGVGAAFYGGTKDILANVALQSIQDTYVTGNQSYLDRCDIHGSVDYICGGGNHYFDHCNIIHEIAGGYITAPATSANDKYGYVFESNTISGHGPYDLGRPWQNEPRAFFLNTVMEILPNDGAWGGMGTLPTHFFEYNSVDKSGNAVDLSVRKNSPTSTNSYTPVLTAEQAAHLTVRNVLCGTDSWDPASATIQCDAPADPAITDGKLTWSAVNGASYYAVFKNGEFLANATKPSFELMQGRDAAADTYTVRSANAFGGLGAASKAIVDSTTGIDAIIGENEAASVIYYNLQGVEVNSDSKGILIRVEILPDGTRRSSRIAR